MCKMTKVLHVLGTTNLGGAESRIMDLYRHIDREQVQFDFLVHMDPRKYAQAIADGVPPEEYREEGHFDSEIKALGGHVYVLPRFVGTNIAQYKKACKYFFSDHHDYSVVQGHMTSTASIYLPIAKKCGVQTTVAHTRNAGVDAGIKGIVTKFLRKSLYRKADFLFACSHLAGDATFGGHEYTYIPNTIDTSRFMYDESFRREIRDLYGIPEEAVVIGNVARFTPQKNQCYLTQAFASLLNNVPEDVANKVYLMFCGDGDLKFESEAVAKESGIDNQVIFAGNQKEIEKYYSAMDIYAFPSIYEGLPGVVVEAQASGLTCLISNTITTEVILTDVTTNLRIDKPCDIWADKLEILISEVQNKMHSNMTDSSDFSYADYRKGYVAQVRAAGFDVNDLAIKMEKFYLNPEKNTLPI